MKTMIRKSAVIVFVLLALVVCRCAKEDAGFERDNPFDSEGGNWNPPVVTARSDTAVSFSITTSVTVTVVAEDANNSGSIEKYYWDIGANGWDDSTATGLYTVTTTIGGAVIIRWAARDNDGVMTCDTFAVIFNRQPSSATVTAPTSNESWIAFDWTTGKGSLPLTMSATDLDGAADTITFSLWAGPSAGSLTQKYTGTGTTYNLTGVDSSATVYYRLVAHDLFSDSVVSTGTFVAPTAPPPGVYDYDGNFYPTVIIGNQLWTTVNLRVTRYNDGTGIQHVTGGSTWAGLSSGAYCFYNNSTDDTGKEKCGALYNWYGVNTGKLAPAGWRVPTDADWTELSDYLGGGSVAGGKMKEVGTANWLSPNTGATDSCDFSALPNGYRDSYGYFATQSTNGYWWSSTEDDASYAYNRYVYYKSDALYRGNRNKEFGFSVRLVRDLN